MGLTSIKPESEVFVRIPSLWPHAPTLHNFTPALQPRRNRRPAQQPDHGRRRRHPHHVLATYAAYSFAKFRYRGRMPLMYPMLSAQ